MRRALPGVPVVAGLMLSAQGLNSVMRGLKITSSKAEGKERYMYMYN